VAVALHHPAEVAHHHRVDVVAGLDADHSGFDPPTLGKIVEPAVDALVAALFIARIAADLPTDPLLKLVRVVDREPLMEALAATIGVTLTFAKRQPVSLAVVIPAALIKQLERCETALTQSWGLISPRLLW
jgi:hypothetical protein